MELSNKIEIARVTKMIEDLDRKLDKSITIPDSSITEASRNFRTLDQVSKVAFEEEQHKIEAFKSLATLRPRNRDGLNHNHDMTLIQILIMGIMSLNGI